VSDYPTTLFDAAHDAYQVGRHAEAEASLRLLLGTGWRDGYVSYFIGHLKYLQGDAAAALCYLDASVDIEPDLARAHNDRGEVLRVLGRHEEAVACFQRAIELEPALAHPYGNLGAVLHALDRDEEALGWLHQSLCLATDRAIAHCDLGVTLAWLNRHQEAIEQFRLAQHMLPGHPRARYSESLSLLALGDFAAGWRKHESRLRDPANMHVWRHSPQPAWQGESDIAGQTLLLHAEQGHGDTIQFVRYVPYVIARGATVLLQVPASLAVWFAGIDGVGAVFAPNDVLPPFDRQCSLMSLPYALRDELDRIPAVVPYLTVDAARVAVWRARLGPQRRMRVGIAWSGNARHNNDRNRSIPLALLARLLSHPDIDFHVLQNDVRAPDQALLAGLPQVHDHGEALGNFAGSAALASLMDLVLTVDTVFAHLAGALALPTWVMLPWACDWRWQVGRGDSPWYPTMRLFRQRRKGDWPGVLADVARALDGRPR
jgi:tetratricopeptide (TPR) repeat protein